MHILTQEIISQKSRTILSGAFCPIFLVHNHRFLSNEQLTIKYLSLTYFRLTSRKYFKFCICRKLKVLCYNLRFTLISLYKNSLVKSKEMIGSISVSEETVQIVQLRRKSYMNIFHIDFTLYFVEMCPKICTINI